MLKFHVGKTGNWIFFAWKCMKNSNWNHFNLIEKSANNTVLKNNIKKKLNIMLLVLMKCFYMVKRGQTNKFSRLLNFFSSWKQQMTHTTFIYIFFMLWGHSLKTTINSIHCEMRQEKVYYSTIFPLKAIFILIIKWYQRQRVLLNHFES